MPSSPSPTLRQLAALAGVSRATVSLALNNHPRIPVATRTAIQKLAREQGYRQDPVVSSLMARLRVARSRRTEERLAFLTLWRTRDDWRNTSNNLDYYKGICERAGQLGYGIDEIWASEPGLTAGRLSKILFTRSIRGVIVAPCPLSHATLSLDWEHFAFATIGFSLEQPPVDRVVHNHYGGMQTALTKLSRLGYRRIGLATTREQIDRVNQHWLAALLVYQQGIPAAQRVPPLLLSHDGHHIDECAFEKWIGEQAPDVVVSNLLHPLEILERRMGMSVPRDMGFMSLDAPARKALEGPDGGSRTCSGIDQHPEKLGVKVVDAVVSRLHLNALGLAENPQTVLISGSWIQGGTLRDPGLPAKAPPAGRARRKVRSG